MKIIYTTERLYTREMTMADLPALAAIMQDPEAMRAYEGPFSDEETLEWLKRQLNLYFQAGFGLWAVVLRESGEMVGQCGLTRQMLPQGQVLEIGYLFMRKYWHLGYAAEAARGCRQYAFDVLGAKDVCSIIRDANLASMNVAIRTGMTVRGLINRHYRGADMPHYIFSMQKDDL